MMIKDNEALNLALGAVRWDSFMILQQSKGSFFHRNGRIFTREFIILASLINPN